MSRGFNLPQYLDYALGIVAFTVEGFLFAFHLHSRAPLDIHLHTLLVYAICGCVLSTCLEFARPEQVLFTYGRILFTFLQGTWFWQIGFILYPPFESAAFKWNRCDHEQIMTATMNFCLHVLIILTGLLVQMCVINCLYNKSKQLKSQWDELIFIELSSSLSPSLSDSIKNTFFRTIEQSETKFSLLLNSEDEEQDEDENIEFDRARLALKKANSYNINKNVNNKSDLNNSFVSYSTSGNVSVQ